MKSIVEAKTSAANTKLEIELLPGYNDTIIVSTNNDNNNSQRPISIKNSLELDARGQDGVHGGKGGDVTIKIKNHDLALLDVIGSVNVKGVSGGIDGSVSYILDKVSYPKPYNLSISSLKINGQELNIQQLNGELVTINNTFSKSMRLVPPRPRQESSPSSRASCNKKDSNGFLIEIEDIKVYNNSSMKSPPEAMIVHVVPSDKIIDLKDGLVRGDIPPDSTRKSISSVEFRIKNPTSDIIKVTLELWNPRLKRAYRSSSLTLTLSVIQRPNIDNFESTEHGTNPLPTMQIGVSSESQLESFKEKLAYLLGAVDNSSPKALRLADCTRDQGPLLHDRSHGTDIERTGSRGQDSRRRDLNWQQTQVLTKDLHHKTLVNEILDDLEKERAHYAKQWSNFFSAYHLDFEKELLCLKELVTTLECIDKNTAIALSPLVINLISRVQYQVECHTSFMTWILSWFIPQTNEQIKIGTQKLTNRAINTISQDKHKSSVLEKKVEYRKTLERFVNKKAGYQGLFGFFKEVQANDIAAAQELLQASGESPAAKLKLRDDASVFMQPLYDEYDTIFGVYTHST